MYTTTTTLATLHKRQHHRYLQPAVIHLRAGRKQVQDYCSETCIVGGNISYGFTPGFQSDTFKKKLLSSSGVVLYISRLSGLNDSSLAIRAAPKRYFARFPSCRQSQ